MTILIYRIKLVNTYSLIVKGNKNVIVVCFWRSNFEIMIKGCSFECFSSFSTDSREVYNYSTSVIKKSISLCL